MLGGADYADLVARYGTPLYVMEEDKIRSAMRSYRDSIDRFYEGKGLICYASKAFSCKEIYRIAMSEEIGADVVSAGELNTALSVNFPMERVFFHGNAKSDEELEMAVKNKVGHIVVDNIDELRRLSKIAGELNECATIMLRVKPGVEAHTHEFVMTGGNDSKFGFSLSTGEVMAAIKEAITLPDLCLTGLHCHIGSQIHEIRPFVETARIMMDLIADVKKETGLEISELNLGGGYGIRYTDEDDPIPYEDYMRDVSEMIRSKASEHGIGIPYIYMEPGRSIVGEAGTTLYTVGSVKEIPDARTYVAVDGGLFENPRYSLYGSRYDFILADRTDAPVFKKVSIAGRCCETDLLGEDVPMPEVKAGDIIAVLSTGAYNYSMASNYNRNRIPPVVMVSEGRDRIIIRPQSLDDLMRYDV